MNRLNPLRSALQFFAGFIGTVILSIFLGVVGALMHEYIGIALFLITFIAGTVGSLKIYLIPSATAQPL